MGSKSYYLQQVHQPRHLSKSARLLGPDVLEVPIIHHFTITFYSQTNILLDSDRMPVVGCPHYMAPYHRLPLPSLHLPIRGCPASLHGQSRLAHCFIDRGTRRRVLQDPAVLLHWEPHLDLAGVYSTSVLVPHR